MLERVPEADRATAPVFPVAGPASGHSLTLSLTSALRDMVLSGRVQGVQVRRARLLPPHRHRRFQHHARRTLPAAARCCPLLPAAARCGRLR
jgi:hypothetical protein